MGLQANERVELTQAKNGIHIQNACRPHQTLEECLTAFYGKPIDQIPRVEKKWI